MKKLLLGLALCTSLVSMASGTDKEKNVTNYRASQNLAAQFGPVDNVSWSRAKGDMYRADFTQDDEKISAFFDNAGEYVASTRPMTMNQLSHKLRKAVQAKFKGETIATIFELSSPTESAVFIEIEKPEGNEVYKTDIDGQRFTRHKL